MLKISKKNDKLAQIKHTKNRIILIVNDYITILYV